MIVGYIMGYGIWIQSENFENLERMLSTLG